jgi:hypothetical protein
MRYANRVGLVALSLALFACTSAPKKQDFAEIPNFQSVAIVDTEEIPAVEYLKGAGEKSIEGMQVGSTTGMASGMVAGALLCGVTGPFAGICITGLGSVGLLVGGAGGLMVGFGGVSDNHADRIRETLFFIDQKHDFQRELKLDLLQRVPEEIVVAPAEADIKVAPTLFLIDVEQDSSKKIHLELKGQLLFTWIDSAGDEYVGKADFMEKSDTALIDDWLKNSGARFEQELAVMITGLAGQMTERITMRVGN